MNDYRPNSNRFKEEQKNQEKKIEKVVTGPVITRKKNGFQKIANEFISEDAKNIKSYVFGEILIPVIKKAFADIVKDGIDIILYGETKPSGKHYTSDRISYGKYYDGNNRSSTNTRASSYSGYVYDDVILSNRAEAQEVLDRLDEIMDTYGLVRVADLNELLGIVGAPYTDNKYGWTNIRNANIVRVREGWMIKMPRAVPID